MLQHEMCKIDFYNQTTMTLKFSYQFTLWKGTKRERETNYKYLVGAKKYKP